MSITRQSKNKLEIDSRKNINTNFKAEREIFFVLFLNKIDHETDKI